MRDPFEQILARAARARERNHRAAPVMIAPASKAEPRAVLARPLQAKLQHATVANVVGLQRADALPFQLAERSGQRLAGRMKHRGRVATSRCAALLCVSFKHC
jgi:hypothetical protein